MANPFVHMELKTPDPQKARAFYSKVRVVAAVAMLAALGLAGAKAAWPANSSPEYARHFAALGKLSVDVGNTMPTEQYGFKPHPESMSFGELMSHIAKTNYQFCAGLKDTETPSLPSPTDKEGVIKFLSDSFAYCSGVIANLTDEQLNKAHDSPDGHLPGRDVLLVMYIHVAHHRGQAEIYLRDKGIKPPQYRV
jgi:uncharacterized damage-inducible protein DinB